MMQINYTKSYAIGKNFRQQILVLHYTAGNFARSLEELTGPNVSAHYLIPTERSIDPSYTSDKIVPFSIVPENLRAWHAGVSQWKGKTDLNDSSIGIEIVNMSTDLQFLPYPDSQIEVVIELCLNILARYPDISPCRVVGHSDIAPLRKRDPGPTFPWRRLYDRGIGAWFDDDTMLNYKHQFEQRMPSAPDVMQKLKLYGYCIDSEIETVVKAFQAHFRPSSYTGVIDAETAAIAYALVDKYIIVPGKQNEGVDSIVI